MANQTATDRHEINKVEVLARLDAIKVAVNEQDSSAANWGDVGDMAHINALLLEITDFVNI